jgi:hypothetical protein
VAKLNRAAFSREDVEDAKRGHPDFDLRGYAAGRGLEWLDHTTPAGYRAAVPGSEELQSSVLRGTLPGGEYGVLAHEGLEIGYSADSFDWGGTYYGIRVVSGGVGLRGMLPLSGRANEATVRIPCTLAAVRLPESIGAALGLRIDTRHSAPPFSFGHRAKLDSLVGVDGWSIWGCYESEADAIARIVAEPVAELLREHAEDGLFQLVAWWGTLIVRCNGYLRDAETLDRLTEAACLLASRLREIWLSQAQPQPFASELPRHMSREFGDPATIFNLSDGWNVWVRELAARFGLQREDPLAYHRAFPSLPVPGQAAVVLRGALAGVGDCRLAVHRERDASRPVLLVAEPSGFEPTPPGGIAFRERGVRLESGGGILAVWATSSYWGNAMAGDIDAFLAATTSTLEEARS